MRHALLVAGNRGWRHLLLALCVAASPACGAGWRRVELGPRTQLAPRQQVQVWTTGGEEHVLHALEIDSAHVSGVPFHLPPDCDSCRVSLPSAAIDSLRLGSKPHGLVQTVGVGYLVMMGVLLATMRWM